jgi:anti-anti-sigma factor
LQKHALEVAVEELEGIPVVRASGELDLATIPEVRAIVSTIMERRPRTLVFDFDGITYLDSSGLGILVSAKKRLGEYGGELVIISSASCVRKALQLSGLEKIIRVFDTEGQFRGTRGASLMAGAASRP